MSILRTSGIFILFSGKEKLSVEFTRHKSNSKNNGITNRWNFQSPMTIRRKLYTIWFSNGVRNWGGGCFGSFCDLIAVSRKLSATNVLHLPKCLLHEYLISYSSRIKSKIKTVNSHEVTTTTAVLRVLN